MTRSLGLFSVVVLGAAAFSNAAAASPRTPLPNVEAPHLSCDWLGSASLAAPDNALSDAFDTMGEICGSAAIHDRGLLTRAVTALSDWFDVAGTAEAASHQARFFRALAAIEAQADLFAIEGMPSIADPALMLEPFSAPGAETAIFTLEEATVPFLGPVEDAGTRVLIAVDAPGYQDLFTVYFPRGTAHLTLPAEDMIALAAEAVRDFDNAEVWVSPGPALTPQLAFDRISAVQDILLQGDVPDHWIRVDDGDIDAVLNRPASLANDTEA